MTKNYAVILIGSCVACFLLGMALGGFLLSDDSGDDVQKVQLVRPPTSPEQTKRIAVKTRIGNFEAAMELYALDIGDYPTTAQGLQALIEPPNAAVAAEWDGPYLDDRRIPLDPWGQQYGYEYPPSKNARDFPDIWSVGPDGEFGTEDDIPNWRRSFARS